MKSRWYVIVLLLSLSLGCIKNAPLNPEADIEQFSIDESLLTGNTVIDQTNRKIKLYLTREAYAKGVAPVISVSPGATLYPPSGTLIKPGEGKQQYTVTAENGSNSKTYTVEVSSAGLWTFNFEQWKQNPSDKYEYPVENDSLTLWSSGNAGVALSGVPKQSDAYPTRATNDGYLGTKAAELVTIPGTALSAFIHVYLYAGSMFVGNFNTGVVLSDPLAATEFGQPYVGLPLRFTGYYKYAPGTVFQDENQNPVAGKTDQCAIYAVLFQGPERLNGKNINNSEKIIATAKLTDGTARANFTRFDIPFIYKPGWDSSTANLMLAIVASSSSEGDLYRGAIGSKLIVDSLNIVAQ